MSAPHPAHPPPLSAAEALSSLLWQPYDCRASPPPLAACVARSFTDDFLAARGGPPALRATPAPVARAAPQSPIGGRHARAWFVRPRSESEMRLAVPAPAASRKCAVTVRVPGETSACANVSSVHIVPEPDPGDSAGSADRERTYASAECQTEEPSRRRRARRGRPAAARAQLVPDLLDAHAPPPPPYSTLPHAGPPPVSVLAGGVAPPQLPQPLPALVAAQVALPAHRFPFQPIPVRRSGRSAAYACSEGGGAPKSCCGLGGARPPLRCCVLLVGVAGVCCVAAGAALGALRPHPHTHLTLLLLIVGVGVVLVSVAGLAWRLSARDAPPCRALLGLRRGACGRRLVPRLPPSYRPHHPYAAMLYPEFHYRPPPPTYQASMQEYRLRLLLLDRSAPALSPPPTYRSNPATLIRGSPLGWCSEYSGPPSYRGAPPPAPPAPPDKYPDVAVPAGEKDDRLVTIVQTGAGDEPRPVIVTVSGEIARGERRPATEMDVLAHL